MYRLRLPNDNENKATCNNEFYEGSKQCSKIRTSKYKNIIQKYLSISGNPKITFEHIMPQTLEDSWKVELGENYKDIHKTILTLAI
ncbi:MAG: DUF1524 domain-containing protein [Saprospiraceae bacterium]|nr:DUF1524 domain-containing protein [Saprospiraceae bacterium]